MQKQQSTATPVYDPNSTATPAGIRYDPRPYPERNDARVAALEAEVSRLAAEVEILRAEARGVPEHYTVSGGGDTLRTWPRTWPRDILHAWALDILREWSQDSVE